MEKSLFEQNDGTYRQVGDYLLPNISLPDKEKYEIGVWGQRHLRYLKRHRKVLYYNLLTSGKLNGHLADIENQAQNMFDELITKMAKAEGITEQLKSQDQMWWVQLMNNLRQRVTEMVNNDLIFN